MFHNRIPIFLTWLIIFIVGCDDKGTDPPQLIPGSRDYTWTLYEGNESIYFNQMVAFSPQDIWAASSLDKHEFLWHWNGSKWSVINCGIDVFGAWSLWGKSGEDLYIGSTTGSIYYYNGTKAEKISDLKITGYENLFCQYMADDGNSNVFLVGGAYSDKTQKYKSVIYKFENNAFDFIETGIEGIIFNSIFYDEPGNLFYIRGNDEELNYYLFSFNGTDITLLKKDTRIGITKIGNGIHFFSHGKLYRPAKNEVSLELDLSEYNSPGFGVGRNLYDFFTNTFNGGDGRGAGLSHYNGKNFDLVYPIQGYFLKMFIFEEDLICVGRYFSNSNTFTLHGQLN